MKFKKFKKDDIYYNTVVTYPEFEFFINNSNTYINRESAKSGDFSNNVNHVPQGFISLHEINVNRPADQLVYPFITKDGARTAFRTVTTSEFQDSGQFQFGDTITGTYPLSASINRIFVQSYDNDNKKFLMSLKNPITTTNNKSAHFKYDNFKDSTVNIIEIPSIFYGSSIRKGSVHLESYTSGTLTARLSDSKKNGELIESYGDHSGSVAGIVLYDYGICLLTASWAINTDSTTKDAFFDQNTTDYQSWLNFGSGIQETIGSGTAQSGHAVGENSSYRIKIEGTNKIPTLTMMAHAEKGELNYSNNPTFIDYNNKINVVFHSSSYHEQEGLIKNITKSKYYGHQEDYQNIVYISKIGIYDKNKNLIAIANLANPIKKTEAQDLLFKLRIDF